MNGKGKTCFRRILGQLTNKCGVKAIDNHKKVAHILVYFPTLLPNAPCTLGFYSV